MTVRILLDLTSEDLKRLLESSDPVFMLTTMPLPELDALATAVLPVEPSEAADPEDGP